VTASSSAAAALVAPGQSPTLLPPVSWIYGGMGRSKIRQQASDSRNATQTAFTLMWIDGELGYIPNTGRSPPSSTQWQTFVMAAAIRKMVTFQDHTQNNRKQWVLADCHTTHP